MAHADPVNPQPPAVGALPRGPIAYSPARFADAKAFVFRLWCELALERQAPVPSDLSGACKYGSLFVQGVFGGVIEGHYAHQFNRIDGRLIDLGHDALDVGRMRNPYLHDADYFLIPEYRDRLARCAPRVEAWVAGFLCPPLSSPERLTPCSSP